MRFVTVYYTHIWPAILAALLMVVLAVYSIKNRGVPGAVPFIIACLLGFLWTLGIIFEFAAANLDMIIFWRKFSVIWQLPSAAAITCFLLEYARPKRWLTRRNLILLWIIPVVTAVVVITNNLHHWMWEDFLYEGGLVLVYGPLTSYLLSYIYVLTAVNLFVFAWLFIYAPQNRWPVVMMIVGQAVVRFFYLTDYAGRAGFNFPYTAVGLAFTSMIYAFVLFRFRILGPIPFAREIVLEQIPLGIVVLDHSQQVSSMNLAAERMLGVTDKRVNGKPIGDWLPAYPQNVGEDGRDHRREFKLGKGRAAQDYVLDIIQLKDWRDFPIGQLLILRDVTEQRRTQAKVLEQQRVLATLQERDLLARELHDDLAQVLAFIDTQAQAVRRLLGRGDLETVDQYMARLVEAARGGEVDLRDSIQAMRLSLTEQGLVAKIEQHLEQFEQSYEIRTDLKMAEAFDDSSLPAMVQVQLLRILQEALTNARKHAQANQVWVKFDVIEGALCVIVEDDGLGFDITASQADVQKHFGLQMMQERAEAIGGRIEFSSRPGVGTKIVVCVPFRESVVVG